MTAHNPHLAYRPDIDGLRAIAVVSVVAFHAFPSWVKAGFIGVDLFFVISGFLISGIIIKGLENGQFSLSEFYARRIKRIFPALILVLLACLSIGWLTLRAAEYKAVGRQVLWGAGFVGNLLMKKEAGYFDTAAELKPLLHLWSLGIEEQFYLVWPLLLLIAYRLRFNLLTLIAALLLLSFGINLVQVGEQPTSVFFSPHTRFWELWIGSLLAYVDRHRRDSLKAWFDGSRLTRGQFIQGISIANLLAWAGVLLFALALLLVEKGKPFPGALALLPTLSAFCLIAAGPQAWFNHHVLGSRPFVAIGMISYPLYLWHWPLLSFVKILEQGTPSPEVITLALVLSVLLAWVTYAWIEKRLRFRKHWVVTAGLAITMTLLALAGDQVTRMKGFPERMVAYEDNPGIEDLNAFFREITSQYQPCSPKALQDKALRQNEIIRCQQTAPEGTPQTVALIGDSHAEHFFPGLAKHGFPNENLVYFANGCLPFWDLTGYKDCSNVTDVLNYVVAQPSIHTVVLANLWQGWWNAPNLGLAGHAGLTGSGALYKEAFAATLRRLVAARKQVIFVFNVPLLGFLPESCQGRPYTLEKKARTPCAIARTEVVAQQREYRKLSLEVLRDFPMVKLWDPLEELCDEQWCWAAEGNRALYRDDNHLTTTASYRLGRHFISGVKSQ